MNANYFEFYDIPIDFSVDAKALKKIFLGNSKKYHPDFHAQATASEQEKVLELATLNNQAYKILGNLDRRIKYILELKEMLVEGERYALPPAFLMEMMDINEALMELQMGDADASVIAKISKEVDDLEQNLWGSVRPILENYLDTSENVDQLKKIKEFHYKMRYLLRIKKSLTKFAV